MFRRRELEKVLYMALFTHGLEVSESSHMLSLEKDQRSALVGQVSRWKIHSVLKGSTRPLMSVMPSSQKGDKP